MGFWHKLGAKTEGHLALQNERRNKKQGEKGCDKIY